MVGLLRTKVPLYLQKKLRDFLVYFLLFSTVIYEPILIKYYTNANIINLQICILKYDLRGHTRSHMALIC